MKKTIVFIFLAFCHNAFCQGPPPAALEAAPENKKLIIELMDVSNFEGYFIDYCMKRIESVSAEKSLSNEIIIRSKNRINYTDFLNNTIFNQFAHLSIDELKEMITLSKRLNAHKNHSDIFFTSSSLQSNLELQISIYMLE
ncbi:hypothetical protein [Fluviicola taffensis]|uniref:Uncharacterized protein n=1 Tax=Fluviicola taffensis (strain DSM 16823 / NCIMB 13979 / RW262) TaxID=755732 RepID=F2IHG2_FLUTR|nr:hypothetical protein [Fluviicola taffensis]AEA43727.1 hypothetical protein Fluta_1735 [Fluviicola taffensis DSM 16823]